MVNFAAAKSVKFICFSLTKPLFAQSPTTLKQLFSILYLAFALSACCAAATEPWANPVPACSPRARPYMALSDCKKNGMHPTMMYRI